MKLVVQASPGRISIPLPIVNVATITNNMFAAISAGASLKNCVSSGPLIEASPALQRHRWAFNTSNAPHLYPNISKVRLHVATSSTPAPGNSPKELPSASLPEHDPPTTQEPTEEIAKIIYHAILFFK